jgi:ureidoacrylate peracid hydrolase
MRSTMSRKVVVAARPEPIEIDYARTALVINDMQNAFCSKGGYLDLVGFDVSRAPEIVERVRSLVATARAAGFPIIHLQNGFSSDRREAASASAPIWHKSNALRHMRAHPDQKGKLLTKGGWDYAIVDALAPAPEDMVVEKSRDNGFSGTALDQLLRARDMRFLIICGIATNVGVESTLRTAYHLEYFPLLAADATMPAGPPELQAATEFNVAQFFGWVTSTDELAQALA